MIFRSLMPRAGRRFLSTDALSAWAINYPSRIPPGARWLLSWGLTYEISRDGTLVATVKKKFFTLLRHRFFVDVPGPNDLEAMGDFFDHEYEFLLGDRPVAQVSKRWIALTDSYGIDISPGADDVLILACAVVIDLVCHADRNG